ncbi:MAG TPA: hypothetical protein VM933_11650 [Acidimicrobiales bacterium]|nr:hypothetical protein [Acidimicrobiales bacterium]
MQRVGQWVAALAFGIGLVALPASSWGQVVPPATTDPPATTAAPTTAAPTTAAPTTAAPTTAAPETSAPTTAPPTTRRPAATTTTVPPTTTTPDQLPTLPPRPDGQQLPAPTETTVPLPSDRDAARVSPLFPALSIGGFTVALSILVVRFLWSGRRRPGPLPGPS